mmetsp:Transcript_20057/g.37411  ORF Transcript_20057/g.37411 Transcript_20057/m.37411 type:complete len:182 (-) Transcript_20057:86-631(-)|eukprot:CAMPEP_0182491386 /NCGR_PEP_ID=MMETSP1321-20130603/859_1 /TAXON_ID=91990 /ORGANISM="Bolidomonas sp., Strain RCC1657" /LENGTH=181 /DNA_ID=CAMNT_0024693667 /DNA_START=46 /DNA_END=591 /DNA_ORIENTATION=+
MSDDQDNNPDTQARKTSLPRVPTASSQVTEADNDRSSTMPSPTGLMIQHLHEFLFAENMGLPTFKTDPPSAFFCRHSTAGVMDFLIKIGFLEAFIPQGSFEEGEGGVPRSEEEYEIFLEKHIHGGDEGEEFKLDRESIRALQRWMASESFWQEEINGISDDSFLVALNKLLEAKLEEGRWG